MRQLLFGLLCLFSSHFLLAQQKDKVFSDPASLKNIELGLYKMYDFSFVESQALFAGIKEKYPENPCPYVLLALNLYWQHMPFDYSGEPYKKHLALLEQAIEKAVIFRKKYPTDPEGLFFELTARSLKVLHIAAQDDAHKAVGEASKTYALMKQGFDQLEAFKEFYFTTGLYNYFRVKYPEKYPIYKSLVWMFHGGDLPLGLKQLNYAADNCVFTSKEALMYLCDVYLYYEYKPEVAVAYTTRLFKAHPKNHIFLKYHAHANALAKKLKEVEKIAPMLLASKDPFYQAMGNVYHGLVQEKEYKNMALAEKYYIAAFKVEAQLGARLKDHKKFYYCGLARIYEAKGEKEKANAFWKRAKDDGYRDGDFL